MLHDQEGNAYRAVVNAPREQLRREAVERRDGGQALAAVQRHEDAIATYSALHGVVNRLARLKALPSPAACLALTAPIECPPERSEATRRADLAERTAARGTPAFSSLPASNRASGPVASPPRGCRMSIHTMADGRRAPAHVVAHRQALLTSSAGGARGRAGPLRRAPPDDGRRRASCWPTSRRTGSRRDPGHHRAPSSPAGALARSPDPRRPDECAAFRCGRRQGQGHAERHEKQKAFAERKRINDARMRKMLDDRRDETSSRRCRPRSTRRLLVLRRARRARERPPSGGARRSDAKSDRELVAEARLRRML